MARKYPLTPEEFKAIYSKVPRVTVDLILKTNKGVLLTFRTKNGFENLWHLPGGTIHLNEKVEDTVHRIAQEELGIKVKVKKFIGYQEYLSEEKERGYGYSISLVFICEPLSRNFKLDDQVEKFDFFKLPPENTVEEQKVLLTKLYK